MPRTRVHPVAAVLLFVVAALAAGPAVGSPQPGFPSLIDFRTDAIGSPTIESFWLHNTGDAPYTVVSATMYASEFSLLTSVPAVVAPGIPFFMQVRYVRATLGTAHGLLELDTNNSGTLQIHLRGTAVETDPAAHLEDSDTIDLGTIPFGVPVEATARVHSHGLGDLAVHGVSLDNPGVTVLSAMPMTIPQSIINEIRFRVLPSEAGPFSAIARIRTNELPDSILTLTFLADVRLPPVVDVDPGTIEPVELALGETAALPIALGNLGTEWGLSGSASVRIDSVRANAAGPPLVSGARQVRFDGEGHEWDLEPDGSVATGDPDAFAGALDWVAFPVAGASTLRDGGRTIQLGPTTVGTRDYTRSIHVPLSGAWIRYVDTVRNRSNAPITFHFVIQNVAAPALSVVARTSSGGAQLLPLVDDWAVLADEAGPAIGHVFAGPGGQRPGSVGFGTGTTLGVHYVYVVELEPGASASVLHFALQAPDLGVGMARAGQLRMLGGGALAGLTALEREQIVNFEVPKPIAIPPTSFLIEPLASLATVIQFDAGAVAGEQTVFGSLRVATNDPFTPLVVVPLELRILGTPEVIGVGPDGPSLVLSARFSPNPTSGGGMRLSYALPMAGDASFELYDVRGRRLASHTLVAAPAGPGSLDWTGHSVEGGSGLALAPGVYWTRLTHAGKSVITKGVVVN